MGFKALLGGVLLLVTTLVWAKPLPINTRLGGDFQLPSTQVDSEGKPGKPANLSDFHGKVVLLNFGYTHCPDICPMVVARMTQVVKRLGKDAAEVQGVFVTFDPERDTAQRLYEYLQYFNRDFVGFTGTPEQIKQAAKQFGVIYMPQRGESAAGTLFTHSDFIYLLDRQGRVRALFATDKPLQDMVQDVRSLLAE